VPQGRQLRERVRVVVQQPQAAHGRDARDEHVDRAEREARRPSGPVPVERDDEPRQRAPLQAEVGEHERQPRRERADRDVLGQLVLRGEHGRELLLVTIGEAERHGDAAFGGLGGYSRARLADAALEHGHLGSSHLLGYGLEDARISRNSSSASGGLCHGSVQRSVDGQRLLEAQEPAHLHRRHFDF
jgi:hypothetical protein